MSEPIESIIGIGGKLAQTLHKRGFKTRKDLHNIIDELPISAQMDLKFSPIKKIPREEIAKVDEVLGKIFKKHKCRYLIAGSYRRQVPTSKDIDVVIDSSCIKGEPLPSITNMINKSRVRTPIKLKLVEPYSSGPDRVSALFKVNAGYYKVDFFITTPSEWIPAIVYASGSQNFNIRMRATAKRLGYKLNQRGLFTLSGDLIPVNSEKELFDILSMTYKTPSERTG